MVDLIIAGISHEYAEDLPLNKAARLGQHDVLKYLIDSGAHVNCADIDSITPLHDACLAGHETCVHVLVSGGASLSARNIDGATPLCDASSNGNLGIVRFLLEQGALVNPPLTYTTPLHEAILRDKWEVAEVLIDAGANLNAMDLHLGTPLHVAVHKNHVACTRVLLDAGANVNATKLNLSPLHYAAGNGNLQIGVMLLDRGSTVTATSNLGQLPSDLVKKNSAFYKLLKHYETNPFSLRHFCRLTIWSAVRFNKSHITQKLSLPNSMKSFLLYTERTI